MVVDLSGGPNAETRPVSWLPDVPPGGWTDEYKTDKLVLRRIPAGTFVMGSPANEPGRETDETQHTVTLTKDFYIGVFEVTQRQRERVMGTRPSLFSNPDFYATRPVEQVSYLDIRENPENSPITPNWPESPQVHTDSFMGRLQKKNGLNIFDLPTESQWEYACRAGTATALNSGKNLTALDDCPNLAELGRYGHNSDPDDKPGCATNAGTAAVGTYLPNAWGLYDMHGNAPEWCRDMYGPYPETAATDPAGTATGFVRIMRGGKWYDDARWCRSAYRDSANPIGRYVSVGFRVTATLP